MGGTRSRGAQGETKAYVVSVNQHDPLTAGKMINKLLVQGIDIQQAKAPIALSTGATYPAGSFVISMAQPKMGVVRWLLGRTFYPDDSYTRDKDNAPIRPYDMLCQRRALDRSAHCGAVRHQPRPSRYD